MNARRLVILLLSLAVTAIFLVLALRRVDLSKLIGAIASADYRRIALAAVCTLTSYALRTARWRRFLAPTRRIPISRLFPILMVGFALNNLLPGRPGEFARPYWLGVRENISKTLGLATIVVERVADGIALIALLILAIMAFAPLKIDLPPIAETIAFGATILFGAALAGLMFLLLREQLALSLFKYCTRLLPHRLAARLERMLGSFIIGLHSLKSPRDVWAIVALSLTIWLVEATSCFLMLGAITGLPNALDQAVAAIFMMVLVNLGVMIPATPGGVGPYEAATLLALSVFGINRTLAASVALVSHAVQYLLTTGLGLFFIWHAGMSLAQASKGEAEA